jgi:hypothetical protein
VIFGSEMVRWGGAKPASVRFDLNCLWEDVDSGLVALGGRLRDELNGCFD